MINWVFTAQDSNSLNFFGRFYIAECNLGVLYMVFFKSTQYKACEFVYTH